MSTRTVSILLAFIVAFYPRTLLPQPQDSGSRVKTSDNSSIKHEKLSFDIKEVARKEPQRSLRALIKLRSSVGKQQCNKLAESFGLICEKTFKNLPLIQVRGQASQIAHLAESDLVEYSTPDRKVHGLATISPDYSVATIGALLAQAYGFDGKGIGVAVIDSGIDSHKDLESLQGSGQYRVVYSESFIEGVEKRDTYGHGTHVAGLIAGTGYSSRGLFKGVAPGVHLLSFRVLDNLGLGTDSGVIAAIDRVIELKDTYNIRILNLSLGRPVFESYRLDPLCQAVERAWNAGIVVIVAAGNFGRLDLWGNHGYGTITSPSNHPAVITVGATRTMRTQSRSDDQIASYSSKGPTLIDHIAKPDLVAPGNLVISLLTLKGTLPGLFPKNIVPIELYEAFGDEPAYFVLSGTSMATALVSGAAALILQKYPFLGPDQVKALLMRTAWKYFPPLAVNTDPVTGQTFVAQHDIFTVGAGAVDLLAALTSSELPPPGKAFSPRAVVDPSSRSVFLVGDRSAIWGNNDFWSYKNVWGDHQFFSGESLPGGSAALRGTAAVWGTGGTQGYGAIWGTTSPFGTGALWGTAAVWGTSVVSSASTESSDLSILGWGDR